MDDLSPFTPLMEGRASCEAHLTALQKSEYVRRVGIFSEVAVEQLFEVAAVAREVEFACGRVIFSEGELADLFYVTVQGEVELSPADRGERQLVGPGQVFGLYAVLAREPRRVSATARRTTVALAIAVEDFYNLLADNSEIVAGVLSYLARRCFKPSD